MDFKVLRKKENSSKEEGWQLRVVDRELSRVEKLIAGYSNAQALSFNATERDERMSEMEKADLVISMLPARFHVEIARDCIALKKNLITPSYISEEMRELDTEAKAAGIVIMNEIGVDPGLDHMSAMKIIDQIKDRPLPTHVYLFVVVWCIRIMMIILGIISLLGIQEMLCLQEREGRLCS